MGPTVDGSTPSATLTTSVGLAASDSFHLDGVNVIVADTGGDNVMTGSLDNKIKVWGATASSATLTKTLDGHGDYTTALAWIASDRLASGGADGELKFWN